VWCVRSSPAPWFDDACAGAAQLPYHDLPVRFIEGGRAKSIRGSRDMVEANLPQAATASVP